MCPRVKPTAPTPEGCKWETHKDGGELCISSLYVGWKNFTTPKSLIEEWYREKYHKHCSCIFFRYIFLVDIRKQRIKFPGVVVCSNSLRYVGNLTWGPCHKTKTKSCCFSHWQPLSKITIRPYSHFTLHVTWHVKHKASLRHPSRHPSTHCCWVVLGVCPTLPSH